MGLALYAQNSQQFRAPSARVTESPQVPLTFQQISIAVDC
jgi:hypothetical protein